MIRYLKKMPQIKIVEKSTYFGKLVFDGRPNLCFILSNKEKRKYACACNVLVE